MRCTYTNPKPKLKLNVTFDPQRCQKHNASHYGAHLATYDQVAQYSTCTCGSDPLLLALVVFFHSQLAYLLFIYIYIACKPSFGEEEGGGRKEAFTLLHWTSDSTDT